MFATLPTLGKLDRAVAKRRPFSVLINRACIFTCSPNWMSDPSTYLTGDAETLGRQLAAYGDLGIDHLLTNLFPHTEEAVARYAGAIAAAKGIAHS